MSGPVRRIVTAGVLLPPLAIAIYVHPLLTMLLLAFVSFLGAQELGRLYRSAGQPIPSWLIAGGSVLMIAQRGGVLGIALPALILLIVVFSTLVSLARRERGFMTTLPATLFFSIYLGLLPAHLLDFYRLSGSGEPDPRPVFFLLALVWGSDTAAYAVGTLIGRHKLCPSISPKKTWEGAGAGLAVPVILAILLGGWIPQASTLSLGLGGVWVGLLAQLGDLGESWLKRAASEKESGTLLPGHGGILDRLDSMVLSIPGLYYWLRLTAGAF